MEGKIVKSGWVEKRSQYLKQWRRRWLMLTENELLTYKNPLANEKATFQVILSSILEAVPCEQEMSYKEFCFRITTKSRKYFIAATSDEEMCQWLNLINTASQGPHISYFTAMSKLHEKKALSEVSLISNFTKIKEILNARKQELLQKLDEDYMKYLKKVEEESDSIKVSLDNEKKNFEEFESILANTELNVNKIREVQKIPRPEINFKEFDGLSNSEIQVNIDENVITRVINFTTKVTLRNPLEFRIRRTNITRALKWRYTGERIDALTFSVSQSVSLTGVGICTPYKLGGLTSVKQFNVLKGDSTSSPVVYRHSQNVTMQYNPDESVYKVTLEAPLMLKRDTKYTVFFVIEGSHTYKCVDCNSQVAGNGVNWNFFNTNFSQDHQNNRCDTVCGPIADFYFLVS